MCAGPLPRSKLQSKLGVSALGICALLPSYSSTLLPAGTLSQHCSASAYAYASRATTWKTKREDNKVSPDSRHNQTKPAQVKKENRSTSARSPRYTVTAFAIGSH